MAKLLVLDAGHALSTAGKRTLNGSVGVVHENTMNRAVCEKIQAILGGYEGIAVKFVHDTSGKVDLSLDERVKRCNALNPDLFISIHHNANTSVWGDWTGTEVYYHTKGTAEDKRVAGLLAPKLASKCGLRDRGAKSKTLGVLTCKATAVLVEGGFMDSRIDYPIITSNSGQDKYAQAVAEFVVEYFKLKKKPAPVTSDKAEVNSKGETLYYRVVCNSFTQKPQAQKRQDELKAKGFDSFLVAVTVNGVLYYRVVAGSYTLKSQAYSQQDKLKAKGFDSFLATEWIKK